MDSSETAEPSNRRIATRWSCCLLVAVAATALAGCGPSANRAEQPGGIDVVVAPEFERGKQVASQAGCLACHKIGANGNDGPGANLSAVGERYRADQLHAILDNPRPPMPSYRNLPADDKQALVDFLGQLKSR